ncbi:bifunctional protein-disulfide isomerase/oxidoreductase DsbC [Catenovulum sp. 2E275]|uniref:bifunctional protein-disulfide isomerase/oxidoreductase DsbC n=1 Tax=Catenovulum sp. 2E275 TaxID=2980497 RepID=UPI0021D0CDBE|nr:bifunctional protein-disulfide isomerase/oxidoreductase DsbC [Catenovulum sp. 2E275]MCU4676137.1 bifunctional protein-disulfide isomerase/oxidoreductase DsbC [Catenovulum sp. 2E275]
MFKKSFIAMSAAAIAFSSAVMAKADQAAIKQTVQSQLGLSVQSINPSPVAGFATVVTDRGLFYVSDDAKFLFHGNLFNLKDGIKNETEAEMTKVRSGAIADFKDDAIVYKAKNEKYAINVFTDITCGYCRKMHNEIEGYNDLGITVRYLAFPRGGLASKSYNDMVSVWCANDTKQALTDAKMNNKIVAKTCENTVAEQYKLGGQMGVTGTPAVVLDNGLLVPGYRPPADMLKVLQGS